MQINKPSEGAVCLTFSGDHQKPYMFVKIIKYHSGSFDLKVFPDNFDVRPEGFVPAHLQEPVYINVSEDMFYAWGPPKFPIIVQQEEVSVEELSMVQPSTS